MQPRAVSFDWATPTLAVGGCPAAELGDLASLHGVGAVIDLREEACDDAAVLSACNIAFLHLPTPDHRPPSPEALEAGIGFAAERLASGERVLVHCQHGIGRSAVLALCLLCDQGLGPLDALRLLKSARPRVSPSPAQFEAWNAWLRGRGLPVAGFGAFAAIAYTPERA